MKRISVLIIMLTVVPGVTKAHVYNSIHTRVRWSPYAFGLVSRNVRYSPYAFDYHHPGLIPYWFHYSPYAFSYKHPSGLISERWYGYGCYYFPRVSYYKHPGLADCNARYSSYAFRHNPSNSFEQLKKSDEEKQKVRKAIIEKTKQDRRKMNMTRQRDREEIICRYLKSKNIDFKTNRFLKIDDKTVSVDFLLEDKNLLIKYWNPEEIQSLAQQPEYKRIFYEKYKESSNSFCEEYKKAGGKVYQIESANEREILARLMLCHELNDG